MKPTNLPFVSHRKDDDDLSVGLPGGDVAKLTAGTTLLVGDAVYVSDTNTVNKSTTATNAKYFVGIVVGGDTLENNFVSDDLTVGVTAATSGQGVLIQTSGVALAITGATAVVKQNQLMFDSTVSTGVAGCVIPGTTAGQIIGIALESSSTLGDPVHIFINPR